MTNGNSISRRVAEDSLVLMAGFGAGAGLMYLCDPRRGRARRGRLAAQSSRLLRRGEDKLEKQAKDLLNRAQGFLAGTAAVFTPEETVTDEVLTNRVRSEMGHVVSHPQGIEVHAKSGVVTLEGRARHAEKRRLEEAVKAIPGVTRVENRLAPRFALAPGLLMGLAAGIALLSGKPGAGTMAAIAGK